MRRGRDRDQWRHTSSLIASMFNTVRDAKRRRQPFTPDMFDPYAPVKKQSFAAFGKLIGMTDYESRRAAGGLP